MKSKKDYCAKCRRVTEHLVDEDEILCKRCGRKSKKFNAQRLLIGQ